MTAHQINWQLKWTIENNNNNNNVNCIYPHDNVYVVWLFDGNFDQINFDKQQSFQVQTKHYFVSLVHKLIITVFIKHELFVLFIIAEDYMVVFVVCFYVHVFHHKNNNNYNKTIPNAHWIWQACDHINYFMRRLDFTLLWLWLSEIRYLPFLCVCHFICSKFVIESDRICLPMATMCFLHDGM
jgi:hypothetical protein